jgi:mannose-6-phosphate isomerase
LKLIDAEKVLSVQVHPDGEAAERLGGRPKTESWVVLAAEPTSCLYLGLRRGVTREQLAEATKGSSLEHLINRVAVEPGDVIFIPAGTIHAIGGGLVLAEMQQASDTTYRLHDWGRVGLDGEPRQLHVEQALESIHFDQPDPPPWRPRRGPGRVVEGPDFTIELANLEKGGSASYERVRPMVVLCLEGRLEVAAGKKADRDQETILAKGECALIPAAAGGCRLSGLEDLTRAQVTWPT